MSDLFGALFSAEKSIFLFDPLLIACCSALWRGKALVPQLELISSQWFSAVVYHRFYARYTVWSGDFAWGDRYVSTTVELAAMMAVPLLFGIATKQEAGMDARVFASWRSAC